MRPRVPYDDMTRREAAPQRRWKDVAGTKGVKLYFDTKGKLCGRVGPSEYGLWAAVLIGHTETAFGEYESVNQAVSAINDPYLEAVHKKMAGYTGVD